MKLLLFGLQDDGLLLKRSRVVTGELVGVEVDLILVFFFDVHDDVLGVAVLAIVRLFALGRLRVLARIS